MNFGQWELRSWAEIPRTELDAWAQAPLSYAPPGGESVGALQARVTAFLAERGEDFAVVTHAGVMRIVAAQLHGLAEQSWFKLEFGYGELRLLEAPVGARDGKRGRPATSARARLPRHARGVVSQSARECYHDSHAQELDALDGKMRELALHVRQLREENQQLPSPAGSISAELATLNERVATATRRLDSLIEELPGRVARNGHWRRDGASSQ